MPPCQELVAAVLDAIATGELLAGDKLPSVRGLASEALVNPNTVTKAYRELEHLGASEGRSMRGPDIVGMIQAGEIARWTVGGQVTVCDAEVLRHGLRIAERSRCRQSLARSSHSLNA